MKNTQRYLSQHGIELGLILGGAIVLSLLLWFRLGDQTFGNAAQIEVSSRQAALNWHTILANPLNAPYAIVQRLVLMTGHDGIVAMRAVSTLFAIATIGLFYLVARQWHNIRVAILATWLFISSAWFLHSARLATPEIIWLTGILGLVLLFSPRRERKHNWIALPTLLASLSVLLYIPGMVWLVILSLVLRRDNLRTYWRSTPQTLLRTASILLGLGLLIPLVRALVLTPKLLLPWLGFTDPIATPLVMLKHFLTVPKQLFINGPFDPVHWLGRVPLLSVFEIVMFLLGTYFYVRHIRSARSQFIIILSVAAWILIGVGGLVSLSLIVPTIYLVLTMGIAYMLHEWFKVFPNNPIARSFGVMVVATAILLTSVYQTRSYFVAWRYSPDTATVFTEKL